MSASSSSSATGFSFKNCYRNKVLEKLNFEAPEPYKTGTTISGVVFKGGVVLGADTRASMSSKAGVLVIDDDCKKIHFLANNMFCCGAGTSADIEAVTRLTAANLELFQRDSCRPPRVKHATRMIKQMLFRHGGIVSASLIIGGYDATGPHITCVHPHGSTDVLPFATMGSGGYAAMGVLEAGFTNEMELQDAKQLVIESILAGINNDLGSGSVIQLCVIKEDKYSLSRETPTTLHELERYLPYAYKHGTTAVLKETVENLEVEVTDDRSVPIDADDMGVDDSDDGDD